ncbi:hypothetical protein OHU11_33925 [Streptomyces sp. NBC_00257]|uniref:hypothetical protein n=1 Tax=unclassified Streptomyces TaxID=2593676 RepID=UPI00224CCA57|nr:MULTISPECIES: hypothetical protein [unclassified Streptomyces]WTB53428.1 hypothetical protein OG832_09765 [Streptomyces sp. NBC_00826]WTH93681.1 hypothetical protein OIC43_33920 [Streptomyces sp. NBC_00825]WTI02415.1 hypothetical protein OHA23_33900 [Streptomyces sp. NBC_00822]MCX4868049.1 hypothetical protein [Streptomyces sp. NBC_00906]MCX4899287.1 hypothetical protein [Streptomyces sp. NBC_00892]
MSVLAHGIGAQHDLPLSPFYAFAGAFAALFVSFLALGLLWSASRFRGDRAGRPVPSALQRLADARPTRIALRALGLAAALYVTLQLLLGPDDPDRNPAPGAVYVLLWVGLVPASLLLGPVWRPINPLRTVHLLVCRALGRDPAAGRPLPAELGLWPAAAGLLAFTWLELVAPDPASADALLVFLGGYAGVHLAGAARYGAGWFDRGDAFEVYSGLLARLSPLGRRPADRRLVFRSPFNGLDATPQAPGLVATVCVMLGSTAYDGFSDSPSWITTVQTASLGRTTTATLGLLGAVALVAALYALCAGAVRLISGQLPHPLTAFAHSLVPIALGYLIAHYFTLFVTEGPRTVMVALGTDNPAPPDPPLGPGGVATLQVAAIVLGHVLGVIAAHDRSVRLFPSGRAVAGQLPLLVLMITYTIGGLSLLIA